MIVIEHRSHRKDEDGNVLSKFEVYKNDAGEDVIFSLPGFESIPIKTQKMITTKLQGGDNAVFLAPMKSDLKAGERRIYSTDSNGTVKSEILLLDDGTAQMKNSDISLTIDSDGKIEIKNLASDDLTKLIHDLSTNLQTAVTDLISATVPTALGPQLLSVAIPWAVPITGLLAKTIDNTTKINLYKK